MYYVNKKGKFAEVSRVFFLKTLFQRKCVFFPTRFSLLLRILAAASLVRNMVLSVLGFVHAFYVEE